MKHIKKFNEEVKVDCVEVPFYIIEKWQKTIEDQEKSQNIHILVKDEIKDYMANRNYYS